EAGEPAAETEDAEERCLDIDTEARRHDPVIDPGAHHGADPGAFETEPQDDRDEEAESDDEQAVGGVELSPDANAVGKESRRRDRLFVVAPDHAHDIDADEDEAEGDEDLLHRAFALHATE